MEYGSDSGGYEHYLSSSENKAWKKFRLVQDLNPRPLWHLHWCHRCYGSWSWAWDMGHRFKSRTGLDFFSDQIALLLKWCSYLWGSLPYSFLPLQFTYMIFIYLQSFIDWNPFQTLRAGLQLKSIHVHQSIKAYDINGAFYADYTKIGAFSLLHMLFSRVLVVSCCLLLSVRQYPSFWLKLFFENILSDEYFWFLIGVYCLILRKNWTLFAKFRNGVSDISFYFSLLNRESNLIVKLLCAKQLEASTFPLPHPYPPMGNPQAFDHLQCLEGGDLNLLIICLAGKRNLSQKFHIFPTELSVILL